jgi:hypothetical protein
MARPGVVVTHALATDSKQHKMWALASILAQRANIHGSKLRFWCGRRTQHRRLQRLASVRCAPVTFILVTMNSSIQSKVERSPACAGFDTCAGMWCCAVCCRNSFPAPIEPLAIRCHSYSVHYKPFSANYSQFTLVLLLWPGQKRRHLRGCSDSMLCGG